MSRLAGLGPPSSRSLAGGPYTYITPHAGWPARLPRHVRAMEEALREEAQRSGAVGNAPSSVAPTLGSTQRMLGGDAESTPASVVESAAANGRESREEVAAVLHAAEEETKPEERRKTFIVVFFDHFGRSLSPKRSESLPFCIIASSFNFSFCLLASIT